MAALNNERKTRFELATYSLEGYRSTNWATSALSKDAVGKDSSFNMLYTADIETALHRRWTSDLKYRAYRYPFVAGAGLEPAT